MQDDLGGPQDARADAHQPHTTARAQLLEQIQFVAEIVEIHRHGAHPVALGDLLHRLQEVAAGHHGALAGAFKHGFQLFHGHHFHGHVQVRFQLLGNQHRGADVFPWGRHQHPGAATQSPIHFPGQQFAGLLQGASGVEQAIDALPHLPINIGQGLAAQARRRLDFPWFLLVTHIDARSGHGFDDPIGLQLAIDLADGVAVQAGLHG